MRSLDTSQEEVMKEIQKVFKKRGSKALEIAKEEMLQEKIECKQAKEAIEYFMTQYWQDLARPSLLSIFCEAVGGEPELTTSIAVPLILISGAVDIQDDIIDQSTEKRGKPTVYGKFGSDIALIVADFLLFKGFTLLHAVTEKLPLEKVTSVFNIVKDSFYELGDAESLELGLRKRADVTPEEFLTVARKKAAHIEAYARIGAILGDGTKAEMDALSRFGAILGMLLVMQDEYIDMLDSDEFLHRLKYECLPLPLLYVLKNPKNREKIEKILQDKKTKRSAEEILKIASKTQEARDFKKAVLDLAEEASIQLSKIRYSSYIKLLLSALVTRFEPF